MFYYLLVVPLVHLILGINIRNREALPTSGPAIIAANHNSHLDALVVFALLKGRVRPVAAAEYFLCNPLLAWFALKVLRIIPLERQGSKREGFSAICSALDADEIVLLFPEGSRGEPEELGRFQSGIAHLARKYPQVPIVPLFMHGLGKALPRGELFLVPFFCDVYVGKPLYFEQSKRHFLQRLEKSIKDLSCACRSPAWH